ncbi:hypothetical protein PQ455_07415 [Sphingomonas naphthae]|uniref:DUF3168 domain-containing protein n=1 Tax=Sphingomonas naphthae TaxID=1813468 RepID=A0ABY7TP76_9SPHN|nr:hypothetical protein [Sphingomonas naphthae]WCT75034.1 hypothetical protein PQ455_07415 [Sphingomonas naphthae]
MSAVEIIGAVLAADAAFVAAVPEGQFDYWDLPQGTPLPSVLLTEISRVEPPALSGKTLGPVIERIQATVRANSGEERKAILDLIRDACRGRTGTIAGCLNVAVLLAGDGPQFKDADAAIYIGSTDLRVSFIKPA